MKYITGNLFEPNLYRMNGNKFIVTIDALVIPTNGCVKGNGECVMGAGLAKQAYEAHPTFPKMVGSKIKKLGNKVFYFETTPWPMVTFPVKAKSETCEEEAANVVEHMANNFKPGDNVPGWACKARISIIEESCKQLVALADTKPLNKVIIPRVGCGAGELNWEDVERLLNKYLDDRFFCISLA
jgi:hypothetical protein